jgi:hypothetical protein
MKIKNKDFFGKNTVLAIAQKQDPERFRDRTVLPEKGKGKKDRPRNNNIDSFLDIAA